ncbi:MAG TPA: zinc-dependent metalloprotease, partial [Bacteroidota bacterium]
PPKPAGGLKPYSEVITKEAKSDSGLFIAHRIKEKLFFEIPNKEVNTDFLFVSRQAKTQSGFGYGGDEINSQVVKWERIGDKIFLRAVYYASVAADTLPVAEVVRKANLPPILAAFDIQAYNKDSSGIVIDVTELFTTDIAELGLSKTQRERLRVRRLDSKRSFVEYSKSFPDNIETEATITYDAGGTIPVDNSLSTISLTMHHSMVRLPENPMSARLFDARVGFFSALQYDYGYDSQRAEPRRYISRWRLEPKDPEAIKRGGLSEPKKPIVFYIDRGTPETWKPWLKKGVDDWQVAFEKAGFKNAIMGVYAPSAEEDPDWSSEDARYSTIRWLPSEIQNAYGPHISDPRTGEILDADIGFFHNVMNLGRNWYFVQASNVDPDAAKLPLPDSLVGEILRYVAAHEVGHSLGFPHNMKATSSYPVDSLRSWTFTSQFGTEASIMDYGRFNYIAQPGDKVRTIPMIGPYDKFVTEWGYKPIFGANTPDDEKAELNRIAARQETEPYLRFGNPDGIDPTAQTEDLGDDPIKATTYGLKNLVRITDKLIEATTTTGENYDNLREMYGQVFGQRNRELGHVANLVGGVIRTERIAGQAGIVHTPVTRERQKAAMAFLNKEGFRTPTELLKPEILSLIESNGAADRVLAGHRLLLTILFNNDRLSRLVTYSALPNQPARYTVAELLADVRSGVWTEISANLVKTDLYRRNLQRAFLEIANMKLNPPPFSPPAGLPPGVSVPPPTPLPGEARALLRLELEELDRLLVAAVGRSGDRETRAHLQDCRARIEKALNPDKL